MEEGGAATAAQLSKRYSLKKKSKKGSSRRYGRTTPENIEMRELKEGSKSPNDQRANSDRPPSYPSIAFYREGAIKCQREKQKRLQHTDSISYLRKDDDESADTDGDTKKKKGEKEPRTFKERFFAAKNWVKDVVSRMSFVSLLFMALSILVPVTFAMVLVTIRGNSVLNDQTVNSVERMGDGLETLVREVLRTSEGVTTQIVQGFSSGLYSIEPDSLSAAMSLFKSIITSFVQCSIVTLVTDGPIYGCFLSSERTDQAYMWYTFPNGTACYMDYSLDPYSEEATNSILRCGPPQLNSIARAAHSTIAYTNSKDPTAEGWSPLFKAAGNAFHAYSRKAYTPNGTLVGVVMAGSNLVTVNDILASTSGRGGAIVLDYETTQVLSTTVGLKLKIYSDEDNGGEGGSDKWGNASNFEFVYVNNTDNAFVNEMHKLVVGKFGSWQKAVGHNFISGSSKYYVSVRLIERPGLKWIVGTMSHPDVVQMSIPIIVVTIVVTIIVTAFFGFTTYSTVLSIQNIAKSMSDISKLSFGDDPNADPTSSPITSPSSATGEQPSPILSPTSPSRQQSSHMSSSCNEEDSYMDNSSHSSKVNELDIEEGSRSGTLRRRKKESDNVVGKMRFFREIRDMDDSFQKLKAGARALTHYIAPSVAREVLNSERDEWSRREMKDITIMFVGLDRFKTLSETVNLEQQNQILNKWFKMFGNIIYEHDGIIDKFIGNSIMALYGAPKNLECNEDAACNAALSMIGAFCDLNSWIVQKRILPKDSTQIGLHIGIHSDNVLVGNIGYSQHMNYTVCGNAANVASRVDQLCKEYMVSPLVSGNVADRIKDKFLCVFLDARKIRGHKQTVTRIYHLLCPKIKGGNTKEELNIVKIFKKIHKHISENRIEDAYTLIEKASKKYYMEIYLTTLNILRERLSNNSLNYIMYAHK